MILAQDHTPGQEYSLGQSLGLLLHRADSKSRLPRPLRKTPDPHMEPKAPCPAAIPSVEKKFHVLVGVTGSVAALKLPLLVSKLLDIPGC
ncbi:phosphopantothenoylcysteine decarboxylase isoform X4 [Arvicanthis niloticus]|uniref:phosphopantothenoylcysteine decarboxylase isoform X4 n=1 Tax=Arvicanthis niloticus TaxID=61156 RepID=UPI00402BCF6C